MAILPEVSVLTKSDRIASDDLIQAEAVVDEIAKNLRNTGSYCYLIGKFYNYRNTKKP